MVDLAIARKHDKYAIRIDELLDPIELDVPCGPWPTRKDFGRVWYTLDAKQQVVVGQAVKPECITVGDLYKLSLINDLHEAVQTNSLYARNVLRAILYAKMLRLPTDVARRSYYDTLLDMRRKPQVPYEDIPEDLRTDRDHIRELAKEVDFSPEGKRQIHKELVAYGMQTKLHEPAVVKHGVVVREAIYTLADPRAVLSSLQEMSKLDGAYKEAGREEADTIENQASRIKRIKHTMQDELEHGAKDLGGKAHRITDEELRDEKQSSTA